MKSHHFILKKYIFYKCEKCGCIKEKRLYPEKDNFGLDFICRECRYKETCLEKYGVDNPSKTEENKNKYEQTCLEKYGVNNASKNDEVKEKIKKNNKANNESTRWKYKQTCLERYGVDNAAKADCVKKKTEETNIKKYGVKAPCQNYNVLKKVFKRVKYDGEYFDSTWEVAYWIWCKQNNKDIKRNKKMYKLKNGKYCHPDFIVNKQLVEIKGDFLKKQESYKYKQMFYEENNVLVLSYNDLIPIFKEVYDYMKSENLPLPRLK